MGRDKNGIERTLCYNWEQMKGAQGKRSKKRQDAPMRKKKQEIKAENKQ